MITFHGGEQSVWEAIKERTVPRTPIMAAIAYLTDADALPLKAGDVLICNLSKRRSQPEAQIPRSRAIWPGTASRSDPLTICMPRSCPDKALGRRGR